MHTNCSDGKLTPEDLMAQAIEIGLQGMAITDHHSVAGYYRAKQWLETQAIDSIQEAPPTLAFPAIPWHDNNHPRCDDR